MYSVNNIEYYKIYDAKGDKIIKYLYSKDELVDFIAHCFNITDFFYNEGRIYSYIPNINPISGEYYCSRLINCFISNCTTVLKELNNPYRYIIYDNYNRVINIHNFEQEALKRFNFLRNNKKEDFPWNFGTRFLDNISKKKKKYNKYHNYSDNYEYRKDPVPYTHKYRGGPYQRGPRTAKIVRMYGNPEYKRFNRGSVTMVPTWWDDRCRTVQRSWKSQFKFRHQWEKNSVKNFL